LNHIQSTAVRKSNVESCAIHERNDGFLVKEKKEEDRISCPTHLLLLLFCRMLNGIIYTAFLLETFGPSEGLEGVPHV
jgi:hypothetical protein